jgi:hypothetical protein
MTELEEAMLARAGVPSLVNAFQEVLKYSKPHWTGRAKPWSCDVVFHAAFEAKFLKQKNHSEEQLALLFEEKFYEACQIFARGGSLHKRPRYQCGPTEYGLQALAEIRARVSIRSPESKPAKPSAPCRIQWSQKRNSKSELISDEWVSDSGYSLTIQREPSVRYAITRPGESVPFTYTDDRRDVGRLIAADMHGGGQGGATQSRQRVTNNQEGFR